MAGGGLERIDLAADDEQLAISDDHIAIGQLDLAFPHSLDLPAFEHQAAFEAFFEEIVEESFLIFRNARRCIGFFGHQGQTLAGSKFTMTAELARRRSCIL